MATMGNNLSGHAGEVRMTVEIVRKETGLKETHELVGYVDEQQLKDMQDGSNAQHSGS